MSIPEGILRASCGGIDPRRLGLGHLIRKEPTRELTLTECVRKACDHEKMHNDLSGPLWRKLHRSVGRYQDLLWRRPFHESTTPLHIACEAFARDTITILLDANANPFIKDNRGKTPLEVMKQKQKTDNSYFDDCIATVEEYTRDYFWDHHVHEKVKELTEYKDSVEPIVETKINNDVSVDLGIPITVHWHGCEIKFTAVYSFLEDKENDNPHDTYNAWACLSSMDEKHSLLSKIAEKLTDAFTKYLETDLDTRRRLQFNVNDFLGHYLSEFLVPIEGKPIEEHEIYDKLSDNPAPLKRQRQT